MKSQNNRLSDTNVSQRRGRPRKERSAITSYPKIRLALVELMSDRQKEIGRILTLRDTAVESGAGKAVVGRGVAGTLREVSLEDIGRLLAHFDSETWQTEGRVDFNKLFAIEGTVLVEDDGDRSKI
jgi:hypothetical protein